MEKELQSALVEILNSTISAKNFLISEIPDVAQQLLLWKTVESLLLCIGALILFALIVPAYRIMKKIELKYWPDEPVYVAFISALVMAVAGFFVFNLDWLQIQLAPKLYLAEYAMKLIGQ